VEIWDNLILSYDLHAFPLPFVFYDDYLTQNALRHPTELNELVQPKKYVSNK